MAKEKEVWFQSLDDDWSEHKDAILRARISQNPQDMLDACYEHLPAMEAVCDQIAALRVPNPPRTLWERLNGTSGHMKMQEERRLFLTTAEAISTMFQEEANNIGRSKK